MMNFTFCVLEIMKVKGTKQGDAQGKIHCALSPPAGT